MGLSMSLAQFSALGAATLLFAATGLAVPPGAEPPQLPVNLDRFGDPLPAGAVARLGTVRFRHAGSIQTLAVSPDGQRVATGDSDRTIAVWEASSGKRICVLTGHSGSVRVVRFSPDGTPSASVGQAEWTAFCNLCQHKYDLNPQTDGELAAAERLGAKGVYPNVDFYSGILYSEMGIPSDQFTSLFAISRAAGWLAHWREQLSDNRIFRPTQVYTGLPIRDYVAISRR